MRIFRLLCILCLFVGAIFSCSGKTPVLEKKPFVIMTASGNQVSLVIEIARTAEEQEKGYMFRKHIPDGTGMLFVYDSDRQMHFWMKNTPSALSIAFIDSMGVIREIRDMVPLSEATVSSERSVRYALEVPKGWYERAGIFVGDRLVLDPLR